MKRATTCFEPLGQIVSLIDPINLELYQTDVNREFGTNLSMPILYFTQLLGLAFGSSAKKLGIGTEVASTDDVLRCTRGDSPAASG
jgi:hypothetical protein